ncbi:hypothetical protein SLEP1_g49249 [Rubroshorea leprosula]|uniref:Uncharacterized protein n=1 Tax=Rubroshorea leprosula TaxID=152421 RepID=A0AAV5LZG9_9ROSI|nr:hypothetical protein SLEP1_g49249 [Rubroshorea leprosula]
MGSIILQSARAPTRSTQSDSAGQTKGRTLAAIASTTWSPSSSSAVPTTKKQSGGRNSALYTTQAKKFLGSWKPIPFVHYLVEVMHQMSLLFGRALSSLLKNLSSCAAAGGPLRKYAADNTTVLMSLGIICTSAMHAGFVPTGL